MGFNMESEKQPANWVPNHFVSMLPMAKAYEHGLCFIDDSRDIRKVTPDMSEISESSFSSVHDDINKIISALNDSTSSSVATNTTGS